MHRRHVYLLSSSNHHLSLSYRSTFPTLTTISRTGELDRTNAMRGKMLFIGLLVLTSSCHAWWNNHHSQHHQHTNTNTKTVSGSIGVYSDNKGVIGTNNGNTFHGGYGSYNSDVFSVNTGTQNMGSETKRNVKAKQDKLR
ncbi:uncharacterized protein LOC112565279 [Pomacea canaliculata]|uniref:uncharacterized protein LOC112565279 n=1 Tax=Pomacea canaliculata TaxID=400727 RepID=UPI000D73C5CB|nr:uncharacterized protein LOC112565279 [Pomacea canaliculata]